MTFFWMSYTSNKSEHSWEQLHQIASFFYNTLFSKNGFEKRLIKYEKKPAVWHIYVSYGYTSVPEGISEDQRNKMTIGHKSFLK